MSEQSQLSKETNYLKIKKVADAETTAAKLIAEVIKGYEVDHVFFVEAILRKTLIEMEKMGIKRILAHSEKTAAYMADGYARVRRTPGLCMAQSVGAANMAAGLQDAYLGISPVVAVTGKKDPIYQHRHAYQEILHDSMFRSVTKFNASIDGPDQLPKLLHQAFREAMCGAPGPVHLDVMGHVGQTTESYRFRNLQLDVELPLANFPPHRPVAEPERIRSAVKMLAQAQRPVIVAGGGSIASSAGPEVKELSEIMQIPVVTSLNGKGIILDNHPLNLGVVGAYAKWCANKIVAESDLVMFIGSRTGDMVSNDWRIPSTEKAVIQIDIEPSELGRNYSNSVALCGDAKRILQEIVKCIDKKGAGSSWAKYAQNAILEWRREFEPLLSSDAVPIRAERLCREITEVLPEDAVLVADTGYSSIWTGLMVDLRHPEQRYLRASGSLGWAFPASLGVKCGVPDRKVLCFTGDGGFWYHLSELETAVRCGINTITIINNNSCLGQCLEGVNKAYGNAAGKREELYTFRETDFARIAMEMGCVGMRVQKPQDIRTALREALKIDAPVIVDVVTDAGCKAPWSPAY